MNDLHKDFIELASGGYLGNLEGEDAYAYLRASSERQVEEGSSFSRQLKNIHETAIRDNLRIPFDLVFFDDGYTGFEFEHRPALLKLRFEIQKAPRASHLVIEDIDRLSRNADWQQGFLLEEFSRKNVQIHFYNSPGSALERFVRGFMAQEEIKKARERMRMGNIYKAMDGKVTAKRPRYGYILTKDSHYELHPEESKVMRWVYEQIIYHGKTLHQIAKEMNKNEIPTRFKTSFWTPPTLYQLVKSTVYKGEFYANRHYGVKTGKYTKEGRPKIKMRERPRSEWILVEVPRIVTPEEWDLAREMMARNAKRSIRNSKKRNWLLSGSVLKCAICRDYSMSSVVGGTKKSPIRYYGCRSRNSNRARGLKIACYSPYVKADEIEKRIWEEIEKLIYDPSVIIQRLEQKQHETHKMGPEKQLTFIDKQLERLAKERKKLEAAYQRDIYTLDEFEEKMKNNRARVNALEVSRAKIETKIAETHSLEDKKRVVLSALEKVQGEIKGARKKGSQAKEIPFELKRKIINLIIDVIWVDSKEGIFTIDGVIKGTFAMGDEEKSTSSGGGSGEFGFISSPISR